MPSATPTPIPATAPVDNRLSVGRFKGAEELEVESWVGKSDGAVAVGVENWDDISCEVIAAEVARATLYPIKAIAPTVDESFNVVVTITWSVGHPEAYVNTRFLGTLDLQTAFNLRESVSSGVV